MDGIGEVIHTLRRRKGWTQGQLAYQAKTTPEYVSLIERGKRTNPSSDWLVAVSLALDTTPDYILTQADVLPVGDNAPLPPEVQELADAYADCPDGPEKERWTKMILDAAAILRMMRESQEQSGRGSENGGLEP